MNDSIHIQIQIVKLNIVWVLLRSIHREIFPVWQLLCLQINSKTMTTKAVGEYRQE